MVSGRRVTGGKTKGSKGAGKATGWVDVTRGTLVESRHRIRVAVVDAAGRLRARVGEAGLVTFARSAVKPLQALPVVTEGAADRFGLSAVELALCCGSHGGEPAHVEGVVSILEKIGLSPQALVCGPRVPTHKEAAHALRAVGRGPDPLYNNCSGKHAGMLALARVHGWPTADYHRLAHPVQQRMLEEVAVWAGMADDEIPTAVDGCGVITFGLPISALAGAFARLAAAARRGEPGPARVVRAMIAHPHMVAGTDRLCTDLARVTEGRIFAKVGAEGVYCAGIPGSELGVALKVEDGGWRAADPALLAVLRALGLLSADEIDALRSYASPIVTNSRGEKVGRIEARIQLEPSEVVALRP